MNTGNTRETNRLILRPGDSGRDDKPFLTMLREDGDFRIFCGVDPSEERIQEFAGYFSEKKLCLFSLFRKDVPDEFIGYAGIGFHQSGRYEAEFYLARKYRGHGYCTEALEAILQILFTEGLSMDGETICLNEVYATTIADNEATVRLLESTGFIKSTDVERSTEGPVPVINLFIDPVDESVVVNPLVEYILRKENYMKENLNWKFREENLNLKFREAREYISRIDRVSICMLETLCYENYRYIDKVPEKYNDYYVYGIGMIESEFEIAEALEREVKGNKINDKYFLAQCIEIMLSEKSKSEKYREERLNEHDLRDE